MGSLGSNKEINADHYTGIRKPLRILWINSAGGLNLTSRGKYRRIYAFAKKHQVHLIARRRMPISPDLDSQLCELRKFPELLIPAYSVARVLAARVFKRGFDIVYTNPDISLLVGVLAKLLLGDRVKWVMDLYDEPLPWYPGHKGSFRYVKYLLYRFILLKLKVLRIIDLGLAIGKDAQGGLPFILISEYAVPKNKLVILPNGTDLEMFQCADDIRESECFNVVFVGEMKADTGLIDLLKAFVYLQKKRINAKLILVGTASCEELRDLEEKINSLGLEGVVNYIGEVPSEKLPEIYRQCDIGVYPFRKRRALDCVFPLKVYEYLAMGLPVVATRLYGVSQIVHHAINGIIVDPENPYAMFSAIHRLYSDKNLFNQLKNNTVSSVQGNNWADLVKRWIQDVEGLKKDNACI